MTQINNEKGTATDEISLREVILKISEWRKYLRSKWKIILIACLVGGILGLGYSYRKKTIYNANLTFALQDDNTTSRGLGAAAGLASQFGLDLGGNNGGGAFNGDNLLELLKSRSMIENTLLTPVSINGKTQTLAELYIDFNHLRDDWTNAPLKDVKYLPNVDRSKFTLSQDSVLGSFYSAILKQNLKVEKADKKLSIIAIDVSSKNELFSKYFTEVLAKTVSDFYIATKIKRSAQNVNVLQHQTDSVRSELNSAIHGVASSSDANPNINPALQILRVNSQKRQIDVEANTAILTELVKNLELSKVSLRKETPLIQVIDTPILPLEKVKVGKLKGIVFGGFIAMFLTVIVLTARRVLNKIMSPDD
ncbi:lipopolysaccharide biosynthesis protein [Mucilaginibacter sp. McL0603]|uniref:lipopolysaccharide biosynthesis protein n=1 Tax=Mucilaginibacter sp. McL0603 TaxID=3415670 RepID=UPI003CF38F86